MTIAEHPAARAMTAQEWADLDEDEPGELVDGVLEEEEMPTVLHEGVLHWILVHLSNWVGPLGGEVFGSELKLRVGERGGRKPDASVYLPGRTLPAALVGATKRPPSLVIEVYSPRPRDVRRDRIDKAADYSAFGIVYYWQVDPLVHTLEIFELHEGGPHSQLLLASEGVHAIPGCEGLVLDLDALWAKADRYLAVKDEDD